MLEPQAQGPIGSSPDTVLKKAKNQNPINLVMAAQCWGRGRGDKGRRIPARQGKGWRQSAFEMQKLVLCPCPLYIR